MRTLAKLSITGLLLLTTLTISTRAQTLQEYQAQLASTNQEIEQCITEIIQIEDSIRDYDSEQSYWQSNSNQMGFQLADSQAQEADFTAMATDAQMELASLEAERNSLLSEIASLDTLLQGTFSEITSLDSEIQLAYNDAVNPPNPEDSSEVAMLWDYYYSLMDLQSSLWIYVSQLEDDIASVGDSLSYVEDDIGICLNLIGECEGYAAQAHQYSVELQQAIAEANDIAAFCGAMKTELYHDRQLEIEYMTLLLAEADWLEAEIDALQNP